MSTLIISDLFKIKTDPYYNSGNNGDFHVWSGKTVFHDTESISFLRAKIWNLLLSHLKRFDDLENLKNSSKKWIAENYLRWLCRYVYK